MNALFLKFSRNAESQADIAGAQMLARAGYDPMEMVRFFETLQAKGARDPGKVQQFFSSHPSPGNRAARVAEEKRMLKTSPMRDVGGLRDVQAELRRLPPARSLQQLQEQARVN